MFTPTRIKGLIFLLAGSAVLLLVYAGVPDDRIDRSGVRVAAEIGAIAPALSGLALDNEPIQITFPNRGMTILNFWATWCVPCEIEMPELEAFAESHPDVQVLGVNSGESLEWVNRWLAEHAITFPSVIDADGSIYRQYRIIGQPTTFVIQADGIISHIFYGSVTEALLSETLVSLKDS